MWVHTKFKIDHLINVFKIKRKPTDYRNKSAGFSIE